jgi:6-phospho-3-hexuloisomerase
VSPRGSLRQEVGPILAEIAGVFESMPQDALDPLQAELLRAGRVVLCGQGRTGLIMQALAMRLYHLCLDAHVLGGMTTPPVGIGDLFLVNAASGDLPTGVALGASARSAGARVALITAAPDGPVGQVSDVIVHLPAQTMSGGPAVPSAMPMGSRYELALFFLSELLVLRLATARNVDSGSMRARHASLL